MRIRKGAQVEVWMQEAGSPVGAWRVGEVTWGNGHSYTLRWHDGDGDGEVSGRISRKSVRPRPPPAPVPRDLDAGDMVEVFDDDDCLWKCAEVQGVAAANDRHFDVKIVGAAKILTVPPQRLRVRQTLRQDDVWVALHKDNKVAVQTAMQPRATVDVGVGRGRGKGGYKPMAPGFTPFLQKRSFGMLGSASSDTSSHGKRFEENTKRLKQEPIRCGVEVPVPNMCVNNKQDEMSGEDCDNDDIGIDINPDDDDDDHQQQDERKNDNKGEDDDDDDDDDSDSDSSSDDSSSGSESDSRTRSADAGEDCAAAAPTARPCNDQKADELRSVKKEQPIIIKEEQEQPVKNEQRCDDEIAESREMKSEPLKDQMGAATVREHIHSLELEAYAALMKAFHACGDALSWEKEGLLSDLRVHLHVSNDEHLQVLNVILNRKRRTGGPR